MQAQRPASRQRMPRASNNIIQLEPPVGTGPYWWSRVVDERRGEERPDIHVTMGKPFERDNSYE